MWVKLTEEELAQAKTRAATKARRWAVFTAVSFGLISGVGAGFLHGTLSTNSPSPLVPIEEVPARLVFTIPGGIVFGWIFYRLVLRGKNIVSIPDTLICPKCDRTKAKDGQLDCPCGGRFEDITTMKWVEGS